MFTPSDLQQLQRLVSELQPLLTAGRPLSEDQLAALREAAHAAQRLKTYAEHYPLALAKLWRPHCLPWTGERDDPREKGCRQEMVPWCWSQGEAEEDTTEAGDRLTALLSDPSPSIRAQAAELYRTLKSSGQTAGIASEMAARGAVFTCLTPGCPMFGAPEVRTSQRDAISALGGVPELIAALISGANRAGKTEGVIQLGVAIAEGRQALWVQAWMALNNIPEALIPIGPNRVWISALTFNDALEYHRPKLDAYLPAGTDRVRWGARDQAEARLPGGGVIVSKAAAQKREKFQGASVALVVLDEEHPEDIYEECLARTVDTRGIVVLSMTPLKGITWPHRVFLRSPTPAHATARITGLDNPHISSRAQVQRYASMPDDRRRARLLGEWASAKGIIYPMWDRAVHLVDDFDVPPGWPKWRCIDFGIWFACLWVALDPKLDQLHVYRELKTYDEPLEENARWVRERSGSETYKGTLTDPADADARKSLRDNYGIPNQKAKKNVGIGIEAVCQRLGITKQGHPRLVVHKRACPQLVKEIEGYKRNERGEILKADDHLCDDLRYLCLKLARSRGAGAN